MRLATAKITVKEIEEIRLVIIEELIMVRFHAWLGPTEKPIGNKRLARCSMFVKYKKTPQLTPRGPYFPVTSSD